MSLPIRSERKCDLELSRTPAAVGPGSYTAHAEYTVPTSLVPFATSGKRSELATNADLPGPGQYSSEGWTTRPKASNKLGGGGPRLVPVGTGDTGYGLCTYIQNPGVGEYDLDAQGPGVMESKRQERLRKEPKRHFSSGDLLGVNSTPMTIPVPGKHFGYDMDEATGKITLHPAPHITHKGTPDDHVGPGHYASEKLPAGADKVVKFGNSRTRRSPFATTFDPLKTTGPGPAAYANKASLIIPSRNSGGTSSFLSRTPMAHEVRPRTSDALPRPNASLREDLDAAPGAAASSSSSSSHRRSGNGVSNAPHGCNNISFVDAQLARYARTPTPKRAAFGSSAARENTVVRNAQTPFTSPPQMRTPGPGTYGQVRKMSWLTAQLEARAQRQAQQVLEEKKATRKMPRAPVPETGAAQDHHQQQQQQTPPAARTEELATLSVYAQGNNEATEASRPFTAVGFIRAAVPRSVFGSTAKKTSIFEEESTRVASQPGPGQYRPLQTELERRVQEDRELAEYQAQVEEAVRLQLELQLEPTPEYFTMDPIRPRLTPKIIVKRRQKPTSSFMPGAKRLSSYGDEIDPNAPLTTNPHFVDAPQRAMGGTAHPEIDLKTPVSAAASTAAFRSTAKRFSGPDSAFGNADPEIPGPASYAASSSFSTRPKTHESPQRIRTNARHFQARAAAAGPDNDGLARQGRRSSRPSSFVPKSQTAATCGPGAYTVGGSMVKKSFNVTMTNGKEALRKWEAKRSSQKQHEQLRALHGSLVAGGSSSLVESIRVGSRSNDTYIMDPAHRSSVLES